MSASVPVFKDNLEQGSILASDLVQMMAEVPDTQKAYINQSATNLTDVGGSWQMPNLNDYAVGEIEMVWQREYTFEGTTELPSQLTSAGAPVLFSLNSNSIEGMGLNKMISEIKFNVANKAFTEVDRDLPELQDIYQMQFDQDQLRSYGIYGHSMDTALEHRQNLVNGTSWVDSGILGALVPTGAQSLVGQGAYKNNYNNQSSSNNIPSLQNSRGYVKIASQKFTEVAGGGTVPTSKNVAGWEGVEIPFDTAVVAGATIEIPKYFGTGLRQVVVLEFHEFIVSPNLSNPYAKNPYKKIYYCGGYPFNLSFSFNKQFLPSLLKWIPTSFQTAPTVAPVIKSAKWLPGTSYLRFWSFDTARALPEQPMKTIYYKVDKQTPSNRTIDTTGDVSTTLTNTISTANLSSLPPYIFLYVACRTDNNQGPGQYYDEVGGYSSNHPYNEMCNIEDVEVRVGTQADSLGGCTVPKEELVAHHTLAVLGKNKEFREFLMSDVEYETYRDTGDHVGAFNPPYDKYIQAPTAGGTDADEQINASNKSWLPNLARKRGFNFVILDVAKLNLRTNDGLPIVPMVNYGSQNYKSLTITTRFNLTEQMQRTIINSRQTTALPQPVRARSAITSLNVEYNMLLLEKRLRTLPLLSGQVMDEKVEWNLSSVSTDLMRQIREGGFSTDGDNQLQYVGGSFAPFEFLDKLKNRVKSIAQPVIDAARTVDRVGSAFGLGKRGGKYANL